MAASHHFRQRVAERCPPGTDANRLASEIRCAILTQNDTFISRVMAARTAWGEEPHRSIWRIRIEGQSLYVVVCDRTSRPITILTQEQMRSTRAALKAGKRRAKYEAEQAANDSHKAARARIVRLRKQGGLRR